MEERPKTLKEFEKIVRRVDITLENARRTFDQAMYGWLDCFFSSLRKERFFGVLRDHWHRYLKPDEPFTDQEREDMLPEALWIAGFICYDGYDLCLGIMAGFPQGISGFARECGGKPLYCLEFKERASTIKKAVEKWTKKKF